MALGPTYKGALKAKPYEFDVKYVRADGRRFEVTVKGESLGRCESCLEVVRCDPPTGEGGADSHVCDEWWNDENRAIYR